jgi:hypothetical protein
LSTDRLKFFEFVQEKAVSSIEELLTMYRTSVGKKTEKAQGKKQVELDITELYDVLILTNRFTEVCKEFSGVDVREMPFH